MQLQAKAPEPVTRPQNPRLSTPLWLLPDFPGGVWGIPGLAGGTVLATSGHAALRDKKRPATTPIPDINPPSVSHHHPANRHRFLAVDITTI